MWTELGGLFIYRYKKNAVILQAVFGTALFLFSLVFGDWLIAAVGAFVAFMLYRDCIITRETSFEVKKDRLEMYVHGKLKRSIKWNDIEYVTRTRKNPKWVAVGNMKVQLMLKPSLDEYQKLLGEVLKHLKDNKEVFVHDSITKKLL